MSIEIKNVTKIYGEQKALDDISFSVRKGEIVGFLGPNGAGKTTTMKIITSYLPASSGEAVVCDYDVNEHASLVRKKIGYLPEHNPLYKEMYIREYLSFVAGLHKLKNKKEKVEEMITLTGLTREANKRIGELSKGYRQRVGLAQALIHDPEVLILDEPTTGLDPNQLLEIRSLIKNLGKEKTVLFSSHIMQEVQALCDRVIIINKGKIVADDSIEVLTQFQQAEQLVIVEFDKEVSSLKIEKIEGVKRIKAHSGLSFHLICDKEVNTRKNLFNFAVEEGLVLLGMRMEDYSMEDIFTKLTAN
ncbi:gliding motility-associated ABC transporter ATP-binding subunit GldA [Portibacter lacus]|uniref:Gliding motility-associated ABC transporter ATP-binding subunit GldA n=1 Tax=Portibacter lacus TaxID=1099794 RepID=A0AA37SWL7_9BACT|nr:gliding motility-associated ABC transporter ATP-binding subunit GldA [Portibacter lacus]GLR20061.1 gliding motility-associated ABC transporter ATP-binding subunit GldA [Portibacter lacus]